MSKVSVSIESRYPIHMEVDTESFGKLFSGFSSDEQVAVFRAMVEHMKPHRMQWDYIAIALERDENRDVRDDLSVIFPSQHELLATIAAKDAELVKLREALKEARGWIVLAEDMGRDTTKALAIVDAALNGGSDA